MPQDSTEIRVSNFSLQRQITEFSTRMEQVARDIVEIKQVLREIEERVRALENHEAGSHPLMDSRIDAAWRKIEEHEKRVSLLELTVQKISTTNRILSGISVLLGSTVASWLVSQILQLLR